MKKNLLVTIAMMVLAGCSGSPSASDRTSRTEAADGDLDLAIPVAEMPAEATAPLPWLHISQEKTVKTAFKWSLRQQFVRKDSSIGESIVILGTYGKSVNDAVEQFAKFQKLLVDPKKPFEFKVSKAKPSNWWIRNLESDGSYKTYASSIARFDTYEEAEKDYQKFKIWVLKVEAKAQPNAPEIER